MQNSQALLLCYFFAKLEIYANIIQDMDAYFTNSYKLYLRSRNMLVYH
jgi:hypothetical protein